MNKIAVKKDIELVELRQLNPGQIFKYNTYYYMRMEPLGEDFVRDVIDCIWCCELETGNMSVMTNGIKVKPIYGKVEILV